MAGRIRSAGWTRWPVARPSKRPTPSVKIQPHVIGQPWTALVQMPDGGEVTVTDCWELGGLLDKLEALCAANDRLAQPGDDG